MSLIFVLTSTCFAVTAELRILETTDIHMNLMAYDYYQDKATGKFGLENTLRLLKEARLNHPNNILIDNGDLLQGAPMGDVAAQKLHKGQLHPAYMIMNKMDYTVGNLGNHDFNYGITFLKNAISGANFPYINANVVDDKTGKNIFTPYIIVNKQIINNNGTKSTIKVGIIGFTPPQIMQWDKNNLQGKVKVLDIVSTAKIYIPKMKAAGADLIIAVPHSGLNSKYSINNLQENVVLDLSRVKGIDAILFGHAHAKFPSKQFSKYPGVNLESGTINNIPSVMAGYWGNSLGIIDMTLDYSNSHWTILSSKSHLLVLNESAPKDYHPSNLLTSLAPGIESWHQMTVLYMHESVAVSKSPIYSYFSLVEPSNVDALIHQSQLWYGSKLIHNSKYAKLPILSAVAAFKAGGRQGDEYYIDIAAGTLMFKNVADMYVYPNTLIIVKVKGMDIREWLEMSAIQYNDLSIESNHHLIINSEYPSFNFDNIAGNGFSYKINLNNPPRYNLNGTLINQNSHRIENLIYQNKPLNLNQDFLVVTNNYRANGGGNFPRINSSKIIINGDIKNQDVLVQYLKTNKLVAVESLHNWKLILPEGSDYYFYTGKGANKYLQHHPEFELSESIGSSIKLTIK